MASHIMTEADQNQLCRELEFELEEADDEFFSDHWGRL